MYIDDLHDLGIRPPKSNGLNELNTLYARSIAKFPGSSDNMHALITSW